MPRVPRLRELRELNALSQAELAAAAGVSRGTIINAEAGADMYPATVRKIAAALRVAPAELMLSGQGKVAAAA
jgi:transcriptional regulator with XRE-family HTH domain